MSRRLCYITRIGTVVKSVFQLHHLSRLVPVFNGLILPILQRKEVSGIGRA